jgi:hypothetical protein
MKVGLILFALLPLGVALVLGASSSSPAQSWCENSAAQATVPPSWCDLKRRANCRVEKGRTGEPDCLVENLEYECRPPAEPRYQTGVSHGFYQKYTPIAKGATGDPCTAEDAKMRAELKRIEFELRLENERLDALKEQLKEDEAAYQRAMDRYKSGGQPNPGLGQRRFKSEKEVLAAETKVAETRARIEKLTQSAALHRKMMDDIAKTLKVGSGP